MAIHTFLLLKNICLYSEIGFIFCAYIIGYWKLYFNDHFAQIYIIFIVLLLYFFIQFYFVELYVSTNTQCNIFYFYYNLLQFPTKHGILISEQIAE